MNVSLTPELERVKAEPRARQNVVLEMGMLIAALGRSNVAMLMTPDDVGYGRAHTAA